VVGVGFWEMCVVAQLSGYNSLFRALALASPLPHLNRFLALRYRSVCCCLGILLNAACHFNSFAPLTFWLIQSHPYPCQYSSGHALIGVVMATYHNRVRMHHPMISVNFFTSTGGAGGFSRRFSHLLWNRVDTCFKATGDLAIKFTSTVFTRYVPSIAPSEGESFPHFLVKRPWSWAYTMCKVIRASREKFRGNRLTCAVVM
jgi:hypothetical protein